LSDLQDAYRQISYARYKQRPAQKEWQVNFAGLHRMILAKLQKELIDLVGEIATNQGEVTENIVERIEPILAKYSA
jgi:cob(I)alamin adenosyltransferase